MHLSFVQKFDWTSISGLKMPSMSMQRIDDYLNRYTVRSTCSCLEAVNTYGAGLWPLELPFLELLESHRTSLRQRSMD